MDLGDYERTQWSKNVGALALFVTAAVAFRACPAAHHRCGQAETGFFEAGAATFMSFIRLPPMIFSTSS